MAGAKKKVTKPAYKPNYPDVEMFAALQLSVVEMASCLGIKENTFYKYQRRDKKFREAIQRGRAKAVAQCAQMVLGHAMDKIGTEKDGKDKVGKVVRQGDPRLALEYLKMHGEKWSNRPVQMQHSGAVTNTVNIDGKVTVDCPPLTTESALRMAKAFLAIHGEAS